MLHLLTAFLFLLLSPIIMTTFPPPQANTCIQVLFCQTSHNASIKTCPFHLVPQVKKPYLISTLGRSKIHSVHLIRRSIERLAVIVTGTSTTTLLMLWMLMALIRGNVESNKWSKTTCLRLGSLRDCFL